jgi:hypothetical protein
VREIDPAATLPSTEIGSRAREVAPGVMAPSAPMFEHMFEHDRAGHRDASCEIVGLNAAPLAKPAIARIELP